MENRAHALLAGLFTLCFISAAAFAAWWLGGSGEKTHTYLLETRGNVSGLNLEAQVRYRGIRAGKVKAIYTDPADPSILLVRIVLGRQYRLTDKTVARLNYQGVTGIAYVMLEETTPNGKPLEPDEANPPRLTLKPGLMDTLGQRAGDISTELAELVTRLNRAFDERNLNHLQRMLENLASASEGLKNLPKLVDNLNAALSPENLDKLNTLIAHLEKTAGEAVPLANEVRQLVAHLGSLTQRLDALATTTNDLAGHLDASTLPRAEKLIDEMTATARRLDRLIEMLNDTPQALLFGPPPARPGPGERGYVAPAGKE